jgi:peptidoglycan/xylan/chitin deacetylase (PgdA/CDA1 family)/GT2 family glycosyltransferase
MKFSVLIPTFNRRDVLSRTLSALFTQDFPSSEYEVIVVVDGSSDGTVEMLQQLRPSRGFRYIVQANRGLPVARNVALAAAEGELVLILDDDIICDPQLLRRHAEAHGTADGMVVFGPVPLHPESPPGLVAEQWSTWCANFRTRLDRERVRGALSELWLAVSAPAVNRSISRIRLLSLGGCCDEAMKDCHEDWDLGIRLWKAGLRFHFQPDAIAYHFYVKSDRTLVRVDAPLSARGDVALARKHPEYRPLSALSGMAAGSWPHRAFVAAALRMPFSLEPFLRPAFLFCNRFRAIQVFNRAGVRLLRYRSDLKIYPEAARAAGSGDALKAEFGIRLAVLAYHHVGVPKPGTYPDLSVTAKRFESHMRWLHKKGYRTITPGDWLRWRRDGIALPRKPLLLTFDDAYADLVENAFPVLERYGFTATVFVVTGHIGGTNAWDEERGSAIHPLMSAEQIRHWASAGIEFGAHTRTHPNLATISEDAVKEELSRSREELAALLGRPVTAFAYPYGQHSPAATRVAREFFEIAFTTEPGINDLRADPFLLRRSCVGLRDSVFDVACLVRWGLRPFARLRARLSQRATRALRRLTFQKPGNDPRYV